MMNCPCCGRPIHHQGQLGPYKLLTKQERVLFEYVSSAKGRKRSKYDIIDHLWEERGYKAPRDDTKLISVLVHRINKKFGYKVIEGETGPGNGGFRLVRHIIERMSFVEAMEYLSTKGGLVARETHVGEWRVGYSNDRGFIRIVVEGGAVPYQPSPDDVAASNWRVYN